MAGDEGFIGQIAQFRRLHKHWRTGDVYRTSDGGESMTPRELDEVGFNASLVHTDVMFGSPEVSVVASASRDGEVVVIERGSWTEPFAGD